VAGAVGSATPERGVIASTIWVLGDQLSLTNEAFVGASPATHRVLVVESAAKLAEQRWHVQRAHFFVASMRRFVLECRAAGWQVDHRRAGSLAQGFHEHVAEFAPERVVAMEAEADVPSAACGGAHRLYGLATAVAAHRRATGREKDRNAGMP